MCKNAEATDDKKSFSDSIGTKSGLTYVMLHRSCGESISFKTNTIRAEASKL